MSGMTTRFRAIFTRRPAVELLVGLLFGVGVGVGIAALILGRGDSAEPGSSAPGGRAASVAGVAAKRPLSASSRSAGQRGAGVSAGEVGAAQPPAPALAADAGGSFERLVSGLPGRVELAVLPLGAGHVEVLGGDAAAHGWSTTKVAVLAAVLKAQEEDLSAEEQAWARSAITESSNESILSLFDSLERLEGGLVGASEYVQELLRMSGDEETVVATAPPPPGAATTFGQTEWRPSEAVKFFGALARGCILSARGTSYVLGLMRHIEPSESWGLGSAGLPGVAFKGGWGPESGGAYLVRQSGIVDAGSPRAVAVAIVAFPPPGAASFETGTAMVSDTATWLRAHLRLASRPNAPCV